MLSSVQTSLLLCLLALCSNSATSAKLIVKTGIEVLRDADFDILKGRRVGLVTNATGVDSLLHSTVDILHQAKEVKLVALFAPEHGIRGELPANVPVPKYTDQRTGLPVYSLFGDHHKPTKEMLKNIDVIVYDIQDIGCRSYTYIATLGNTMEAAAENKISFVVLDRPNPLGGLRIEGNLVAKGFESFVSPYPIPYVYGLTAGELAKWINGEGVLKNGVKANLTVVPMKGWERSMTFTDTGLPFVMTSPHIPGEDTPKYYASTGALGTLGVFSEGVGYTIPFRIIAAEWIDGHLMADKMNQLNLPGVMFRPITFKPFYGRDVGKTLSGVQLFIVDEKIADLYKLQFRFIKLHQEVYPKKNPFWIASESSKEFFDKIVGTDQIRKLFEEKSSWDAIEKVLTKDNDSFRTMARKYWMY